MENKNLQAILKYIEDTRIEDVSDAVREHVRMCFLDLAMVICCGTRNASSALAAGYAVATLPGDDATVLRTGRRASLLGATLANAVAANALDIDDGYSLTKGHPGAGIIAGTLAAAERMDSSFGDVLSALLVGYEVSMRHGLALQDYYGFYHSTGSYAGVGTAAAAGKLMKLDGEKLSNALGIADYYGPLTPCMRTVRVPSLNKDGIYLGAKRGMEAVLLARAGFDGKAHILADAKYGDYVRSLGSRYYVFDLYFKFFSCCRWAQGALTAIRRMRSERAIAPGDIRRITVYSYGASGELYAGVPANETEAQYNMRYPIAAYFVHGDFGPLQSSTGIDTSPLVTGLMEKIEFVNEPEYEAAFPARRFTRVEVALADGGTLDSGAVEPLGEPGSGVTVEQIIDKGVKINGLYCDPGKVRAVAEKICRARYGDPFRPILAGMLEIARAD